MALTAEQLKKLNSDFGTYDQTPDSGKTLVDTIADNYTFTAPKAEKKGLFGNIAEQAEQGVTQVQAGFQQTQDASTTGDVQNMLRGALNEASGGISTVFSPVTGTVKTIAELPVVSDILGFISKGVNKVGAKIGENQALQKFAMENPNAEEVIGNLINVIGTIAGGSKAPQVRGAVGTAVEGTLGKAKQVIEPVTSAIKTTAKGFKDITGQTVESVSQIPSRIATNVAEKQASREAIKALPSKVAQKSVLNGVDINDAQVLYKKVTPDQKPIIKKLVDTAKEFEQGGKTDPIEIVGRPIIERMKVLNKDAGVIGNKLSKVADNLGNVAKEETTGKVFNELKKVQGLNGLKVNPNGKLNFKNTTLTTVETASDRKAIQSIFDSATKSGTGKQKHLLRQELFETLGGKKKSLSNITGTQEKAYEAVRKGLSNVLDSKNSKYKVLNKAYATVVKPISEMKKLLRVAGEEGDIMDMSAGLLARKLTSNASSRLQVKAILRAMDNAVSKKGKTLTNVENLQDVYNILDKYYNISGKTTLQSQTASAIEKSTGGITERAMQVMGDLTGKTEAVRKRAIEDLLNDLLK